MQNESQIKMNKIAKLAGIVIGIVMVLGTSYAVFRVTTTGEKENVVSAGKLDVRVENEQNEIAINNALPQTEEEGKKNTPYTFDVVNKGNINAMYDMYIELSEDTTLPDNTVRYYLTKVVDSEEVALDEKSSHYLSDGIDSVDKNKKIYKVDTNDLIKPNETVSYKLYLWIDYDATTEEAANKVFKGNIRVDASQVVYQEKTLLRKVDVSEGENGKVYAYVYADGTLEIKGNGKIKSGISDMNIYNADEKKLVKNYKIILAEMGYDVTTIQTWEDLVNFIEQENTKNEDFEENLNLQAITWSYRDFFKKKGYENTETIVDVSSLIEYCVNHGIMDEEGNATENGEQLCLEAENFYNNSFSSTVSIKNIELEGNITNIPKGLYTGNEDITEITIPSTVTSIDAEAFYNCTNLKTVVWPDKLVEIGDYAFYQCINLQNVDLNEGLKTIGKRAFWNCNSFTNLVLPKSLENTGENAFYVSSLKNLTIDATSNFWTKNSNPVSGVYKLDTLNINGEGPMVKFFYNGVFAYHTSTNTNFVLSDKLTTLENVLFNCDITSIILPSNITKIGASAFYGCSKLTSVVLPEGITEISDQTFYECEKLANLSLPNSVTSIGNNAFYGCMSLNSIEISKNVLMIGREAFNNCTSLKSIQVAEDNPNYTSTDGILFNKDQTSLICYPANKEGVTYTIPKSVVRMESGSMGYLVNLKELTIDHPIGYLYGAFSNSKITKLTIDVTKENDLPTGAYKYKTGISTLKELILTGTGEMFSKVKEAWSDSRFIEKIVVSEGITKILDLNTLTQLKEVSLPNTLNTIGNSAFSKDTALTSITIPNSVTYIGSSAFSGWTSSQTINIDNTEAYVKTHYQQYTSSTTWGQTTTTDAWDNQCNATINYLRT